MRASATCGRCRGRWDPSPIRFATLVASTQRSRLAAMTLPVICSDSPLAYTSAVSMKFTPASRAERDDAGRLGRVGAVAEHHRAQAEGRDLEAALAERAIFHVSSRKEETSTIRLHLRRTSCPQGGLLSLSELQRPYRMNVGCGRNAIEGWINVDSVALPGVDLVCDLETVRREPIGLPDDRVEQFLLSHVIEHIRDSLPLMQELWRVADTRARAVDPRAPWRQRRCVGGSHAMSARISPARSDTFLAALLLARRLRLSRRLAGRAAAARRRSSPLRRDHPAGNLRELAPRAQRGDGNHLLDARGQADPRAAPGAAGRPGRRGGVRRLASRFASAARPCGTRGACPAPAGRARTCGIWETFPRALPSRGA